MLRVSLIQLYKLLLEAYGYQNWWPVDEDYHKLRGTDPREEIIIGAILTQNTAWKNVEKSLENLKKEGELSLRFIRKAKIEEIYRLIRPSGFYRLKAERLKHVAEFFNPVDVIQSVSRQELLKVKGIGKETADAILLYAGNRLSFVVDAYTLRLFKRIYRLEGSYDSIKAYIENNIPKDLIIYKEFHALIDVHAKTYCRSTPRCGECFLKSYCLSAIPFS
ncbi:endonuclease III domain-containing protein [Thermocrinis jamiesonii]|uniref:endonuclease III domain-containing protein n=1 Tax=Thermocrinis jamiesonii TaxID=1302351 RepID=UPI0004984812|nr:endonuclease III domain-containing protein [Thermocrinis jamiesonii]